MNPDDLMAWFVVAPLAVATLLRLPAAVRNPGTRNLWWVFASLGVSMATRLDDVSIPLNEIGETFGFSEASILAKHLTGIVAVAMLLRWVSAVVPGPEDGYAEPTYRKLIRNRPRRVGTWAAVAVIAVTYPFANLRADPRAEDSEFIFLQGGHWWGSLHLILFYSYIVFGMVCASLMCSDARHSTGPTTIMGRCLALLSTGWAIGSCYGIIRISYLVIRLTDRQYIGGPEFVILTSDLSLILCVGLVCAGVTAPAVERLDRALATHAAINDLRPLWTALTRHAPHHVMTPEGRLRALVKRRWPWLSRRVGALVDFWDWRNLDQRLRRRVTEIYDAAHYLQDYVADDLRVAADESARALKMPRHASKAYLLHSALAAVARGEGVLTKEHRHPLLDSTRSVPQDAQTLLPIGSLLLDRTAMRRLDRRLAR